MAVLRNTNQVSYLEDSLRKSENIMMTYLLLWLDTQQFDR